MADHLPKTLRSFPAAEPDERELDEIDGVLQGLSALIERATTPYVRVCLEEARRDVAHLAGRDDARSEVEEERPAA